MTEETKATKQSDDEAFEALAEVLGKPVNTHKTTDVLDQWTGAPLPKLSERLLKKLTASATTLPLSAVSELTDEYTSFEIRSDPLVQDITMPTPAILGETKQTLGRRTTAYGVAFVMNPNFASSPSGRLMFDDRLDALVDCIIQTVNRDVQLEMMRMAQRKLAPQLVYGNTMKRLNQFGAINKQQDEVLDVAGDKVLTCDATWKLVSRKRKLDHDETGHESKRRKVEHVVPSEFKASGVTFAPAERLAVVGEYYFVRPRAASLTIPVMYNQKARFDHDDLVKLAGVKTGVFSAPSISTAFLVVRRRIVVRTATWVELRTKDLGRICFTSPTVEMVKHKSGTVGFNVNLGAKAVIDKPDQITKVLRDAHILDVESGYDGASCEVFAMPADWEPNSLILDLTDQKQVPLSEADRKRIQWPQQRSELSDWENTEEELAKGTTWVVQGPCRINGTEEVLGVGHLGAFGMAWPKTTVHM